ncbi:hypothetical protein T265_01523 [Opisthorchis viverrini]|uniref:Glycosyltransferase, family 8 n=1 Tax=Opisthorchis viverrini TaxID=6198 RepID=A0A075A2J3_OPIVI|nr:hypothetical protein T265_01523 [Opisthorchis viverrini]KER32472.1 hypothetical protein T265_01523 [Opisthorchis viverrini]
MFPKIDRNPKPYAIHLVHDTLARSITLLKSVLYYRGSLRSKRPECYLRRIPSPHLCAKQRVIERIAIHLHLVVEQRLLSAAYSYVSQWRVAQFNWTVYELDPYLPRVKWISNKHRSGVAALSKMLIPDVLPTNVTKAIVLDTDILLNADILELWKLFDNFDQHQIFGMAWEFDSVDAKCNKIRIPQMIQSDSTHSATDLPFQETQSEFPRTTHTTRKPPSVETVVVRSLSIDKFGGRDPTDDTTVSSSIVQWLAEKNGVNSGVVLMHLSRMRKAKWSTLFEWAVHKVLLIDGTLLVGEQIQTGILTKAHHGQYSNKHRHILINVYAIASTRAQNQHAHTRWSHPISSVIHICFHGKSALNVLIQRRPELYYRIPCEWNLQLFPEAAQIFCPVIWTDRLSEEAICSEYESPKHGDLAHPGIPNLVHCNFSPGKPESGGNAPSSFRASLNASKAQTSKALRCSDQ